MINHEKRFTSGPSGISVSMETYFASEEEAFAFMSAVNKLLGNDEQAKTENMIRNVLMRASNRGPIELIKAYRGITNQGLKESKDWVEKNMEQYIDRNASIYKY